MSSTDIDFENKKSRSCCFKCDFLWFLLILLNFYTQY
jgi:hypothetical protein